jgi:DNA-binding IclR family transcriptional regulator
MNPADEVQFIARRQQGLETAAIAERLGIKATTAQSRAHRLQQRGLIEPRPQGGNYPTQRRQAALAGVSCRTPLPPNRVASVR